jgi:hypothetical protein
VDELTLALTKARNGGARYQPTEDEQDILLAVFDVWIEDFRGRPFPASARALRDALFDEIYDRRRAHDEAAKPS